MSNEFKVEIISPDNSILKTSASLVIIPSFEGEIGILRDHIPLITFLRPGLIKIGEEGEKKYFVEDGTVEFSNNNLLILTSTAKELGSLDKRSIETNLQDAKEKIKDNAISDKEKYLLSYKIDTLSEIDR
jgi:F-type H+-transporting ATPase subunit epsilon